MEPALIFDLDNCLAPSREVGAALFEPAFAAMRAANRGAVPDDRLAQAFEDAWRHPLDWIAETYGFTPAMRDAGWRVFATLEVTRPMRGYGDLPVLGELPGRRFLVTAGFRRLQDSKIRALNLAPYFDEVHVDAIDAGQPLGKQAIFERIMARHGFDAADVVVIGDSAESEIAAGRCLGATTVQSLRDGVPRAAEADHHVRTLGELKNLLARRG